MKNSLLPTVGVPAATRRLIYFRYMKDFRKTVRQNSEEDKPRMMTLQCNILFNDTKSRMIKK